MDIDWKALFLSPAGRIKRQPFWIGWIIVFIVSSAISFALRGMTIVSLLLFLASCYPWACIYSKRFHDLGKSGWLTAIPIGLSVISTVYASYFMMTHPEIAALVKNPMALMGDLEAAQRIAATMRPVTITNYAVTAINLGFLLWLGIANSQEGPNAYGVEPGSDEFE